VSKMATRWDSTLPPAFVAHQLPQRKKTMKVREETLRESDFAIQASRTLSEECLSINRCNGRAWPSWLWGRWATCRRAKISNQARRPAAHRQDACATKAYFSLRNSISSPSSSGFRAFFVKSAAMVVESLVSFGITLSLTFRKVRRLPSSDNFQTT
jgi:hypothetical protein